MKNKGMKALLQTELVQQMIRYAFVGGAATVADWGCLFLLHDTLKIHVLIATAVACFAGILVNYFLSKRFVFRQEIGIKKRYEFIMHAIIGFIALGFSLLLMYIFNMLLGVHWLISKIIITAIVFVWNFAARKMLYVVFEKKGDKF